MVEYEYESQNTGLGKSHDIEMIWILTAFEMGRSMDEITSGENILVIMDKDGILIDSKPQV
jgi:hypothetical protein